VGIQPERRGRRANDFDEVYVQGKDDGPDIFQVGIADRQLGVGDCSLREKPRRRLHNVWRRGY
jgi:hypothetical protein